MAGCPDHDPHRDPDHDPHDPDHDPHDSDPGILKGSFDKNFGEAGGPRNNNFCGDPNQNSLFTIATPTDSQE